MKEAHKPAKTSGNSRNEEVKQRLPDVLARQNTTTSHRCSHEEIHDSTGRHGNCCLAGWQPTALPRRRWRRTWRRRWRRRWRRTWRRWVLRRRRVPAAATPARARAGGGYSGGARAGGGYSGGASFNRSPSMSRAAPSQGMNRPSQLPSANRPSQRPSTGYGQGNAGNRPSQLPATRPGTGGTRPGGRDLASGVASRDRPSQGQLRNFLDMPADSSRRGTASSLASPSQLPSNTRGGRQTVYRARRRRTYRRRRGWRRTGPGGATVGAGRVGASYTGPRRQHVYESGRRRGHPRSRRQYRGRRTRRRLRQRPVRRRQVLDGGQRQLYPLELLYTGMVRGIPRSLVAREMGRRWHCMDCGLLGNSRRHTAAAPARASTTTTATT